MYNLKKNIQIFIFSISTCICFNLIFKNFRNLINFQTLKDLNGKNQQTIIIQFGKGFFFFFLPPILSCLLYHRAFYSVNQLDYCKS